MTVSEHERDPGTEASGAQPRRMCSCGCGRPVHVYEDGFTRDMCEECSTYRCDITAECPGTSGRVTADEEMAARLFVAHGHPGKFCTVECPHDAVDACICGSGYACNYPGQHATGRSASRSSSNEEGQRMAEHYRDAMNEPLTEEQQGEAIGFLDTIAAGKSDVQPWRGRGVLHVGDLTDEGPTMPDSSGRATTLREQVARAIAEAADDGVLERDEPECTSDNEDRDYWLRLADAALAAHATAEWREQITSRDAIRSELIRQHLAGECGVTPPARNPS